MKATIDQLGELVTNLIESILESDSLGDDPYKSIFKQFMK